MRHFVSMLILALAGPYAVAGLQCSEPVKDVGEVRGGIILTQQFIFSNDSSEAVEIIDTRPTCGCLTPRLEKRIYQPGENGSIALEINTLAQPAGANVWGVRVIYRTAGQAAEMPLRITGRVVKEVSVDPAALVVYADNAVKHEITITDLRPKPLNVTRVEASSPAVKAVCTDVGRDDAGHVVQKVRVEIAADCPEGRHDDVLSIFTDDPAYRELRVPLTIVMRLRRRVVANPEAISLTAAAGTALPSQIILVRDREEQKVAVDRVTADDPAIACSWAAGPDNRATIKIRIDRTQVAGNALQSAVHIHLTGPVDQVLDVPVTCIIK